jgi:ribosome-associated protein
LAPRAVAANECTPRKPEPKLEVVIPPSPPPSPPPPPAPTPAPPAPRTPHAQNDAARQFAIDAARLAAHTRCRDVLVLDVRGLSPVTDYMIVATGTSPRQMRTVCDDIAEMGETVNYTPLASNGTEGETWMLIDFVDVVIHVFSQDAREFYDLDNLWGDAPKVEWDGQANPA